jgi:hypothetical protein
VSIIKIGTGGNGISFERIQCICSTSASIFSLRTQRLRSRQFRQRFHDGSDRSNYSIVASASARGSDARETDTCAANAWEASTHARAAGAREAGTHARAAAGFKTGLSI